MSATHAKALAKSPSRAITVLLVDDESGILKMFTRALTNYGLVTEEARSAQDALDRMAKKKFDVIVSDINMPGYGGLAFLEQAHERDHDVPVILMTGKPSLEASNQALERGAFRYLLKPVMPTTLRETIEQAVRVHDAARSKRLSISGIIVNENPADQWLARGRAEGARDAVVTALAARTLSVSAVGRAKLAACNDMGTLTRWLARATTAASESDVFWDGE